MNNRIICDIIESNDYVSKQGNSKMENNSNVYEVTGIIDSIVYRNDSNGYTVLNIDAGEELVCAVGTMPGVDVGDEIKATGILKNHQTYGEQLSVNYFERCAPSSSAAILKYLSGGAIKGIGQRTAARIVEEFGDETLDVMENSPELLTRIKGITLDKAKKMSEDLKKTFGFRELLLYLKKYDITPEESVRIWKYLGIDAEKLIEENPYILCEEEIGISFKRADSIAIMQDKAADSDIRTRAAMIHILNHNTQNGHTCLPKDKLSQTCSGFTGTEPEKISNVLEAMITDSSVISDVRESDGREFIFLPAYHRAETYSAARLQMLLRFPPQIISDIEGQIKAIEETQNIKYAELQKEAIFKALTQGTLILTGGPGTGKTTTLNAIIKILKDNGEKVFLAAPTGRAAQRMSELTGCEAKTIHRLLEVEWTSTDRPVFKKNEQNTLSCDALILDEVSMIDAILLESVMKAFPLGCRLILVGDSDQLPSVGAGNVLGDLISSGILPTVTLNEIFRQSMQSLIVTNAHKINKGETPVIDVKNNDFFFLRCTSNQIMSNTIIELCKTRLPRTYGYSPTEDIQVLSPSRKGDLGTFELNKALQEAINPKADGKTEIIINQRILREGDKVMQYKNNYNIPWTRSDGVIGEGIFNGDIGTLIEVNKSNQKIKIRFEDKIATYTYEDIIDVDLAYCSTIHKSQGNEFEAVIIPMYNAPPQLLYRNLLYTAVTRAKKLLILVGKPEIMERMVSNNKRTLRYSGLKEFLLKGIEKG